MLAVSCFFFLWLFSFVEWHSSIGPLDEENPKETNRGDAFTLQKLSIDLVHTSTAKKKSSYKQRNDLFFLNFYRAFLAQRRPIDRARDV